MVISPSDTSLPKSFYNLPRLTLVHAATASSANALFDLLDPAQSKGKVTLCSMLATLKALWKVKRDWNTCHQNYDDALRSTMSYTPQDLMVGPLHIGSFISTLTTLKLPRGIGDPGDSTTSSLKLGEYISLHVRKVTSSSCIAMRTGSLIVALCSRDGRVSHCRNLFV